MARATRGRRRTLCAAERTQPAERLPGSDPDQVCTLIAAQPAPEFERGLGVVPWFAHLGEPSPWDGGCERISAWDQWPGPESALGEMFAQASVDIHGGISAACSSIVDDLQAVFDRV